MKISIIISIVLFTSNLSYTQWVQTNGPYGATAVRCMAVNGNNLYIGTTNGLYVSSSGGTNWIKINNGFASNAPTDFAFMNNNIYASSWNGIFKSTNQGQSWFQLNSPNSNIFSISNIGNTLFAMSNILMRTSDDGVTWYELLPYLVNSLTVYGNDVYIGKGGIYKSTDLGNSWSQVFKDSVHNFNHLIVNGNNIYATSTTFGEYAGIWYSSNSGINWSFLNNGLPTTQSAQPANDLVNANNSIYLAYYYPPDYGVNFHLFYSSNNGANFYPINGNFPHNQVSSLGLLGNSVFAATNNAGIYGTTNLGSTWSEKNYGITSEITCLGGSGNMLLAGTKFALYLSTNGGNSWSSTGLINQQSVTAAGVYNGKIFASGDSGIYISSNNGVSFTLNLRENITEFYPDGNNFFAIGRYGGVDLTTNNGLTWTALNNGIVHLNTYSLIRKGNKLFRGTVDGNYLHDNLFVSTDYGQSWSTTSLTQKNVYSLFVQGNSLIAGTEVGVYISTDDGVTWNHSVSQVPRVSESLAGNTNVLFSSTDDRFYTPSDSGVYYSTDGGWNWNPINDGLIDYNVPFLALNGNMLYAGTINSSVWKRDVSSLVGVQSSGTNVPDKFALYQNYPNPFNPTTKITYDLPSGVTVKLVIYDMLGREVKTLVNEKQNAGRHDVEFDASNYPSGVYYYKLSTDNFSQTKKMVLIK